MKRHFKKIFFCALFLSGFLVWQKVEADTHTAASCSAADVQSSINIASDGDIVNIPACAAGTVTWTNSSSGVSWNDKQIDLIGAGTDSITGTNINFTRSTTYSTGSLIDVNNSTNKVFRISGIHFIAVSREADNQGKYLIHIDNTSNLQSAGWRLDNLKFSLSGEYNYPCFFIGGYQAGLIDSNNYNLTGCGGSSSSNGDGISPFLLVDGEENETGADKDNLAGANAWARSDSFGDVNAIYVENNIIYYERSTGCYGDISDGTAGGRMVYRYNNLEGIMAESHSACFGGGRGMKTWEFYNNRYTFPEDFYLTRPFKMRSGTGVIYNNNVTGNGYSQIAEFDVQRASNSSNCKGLLANDDCDGDSVFDGNDDSSGYQCLDQIGTSGGTVGSQNLAPVYVWGNYKDGVSNNAVSVAETFANYVQKDRDYYEGIVKPGYTAYTCPHPLAGLTGSCDSSVTGTDGYNITNSDVVAPAAPSGLSVI